MAKGKFVLNKAGFNALRNDEGIVAELNRIAHGIQARADSQVDGGGFETEVVHRETRAVAFVRAADDKAVRACAKDNALLKAVRG